jgi:hypothetical protein
MQKIAGAPLDRLRHPSATAMRLHIENGHRFLIDLDRAMHLEK